RAAANECDVAETCPGAFIIGFRGVSSASSGTAASATSLSNNRPTGTLADDVMVATITARAASGTPTITPPSGWTEVLTTTQSGQNLTVSTYWKLGGTDSGPYTFIVASSRVAGGITAYSNVNTTNPINVSGGAASTSTPSLTTTVANTMLVACFGRSNTAIGAPSGMTERFHVESTNGTNDAASESADAAQVAPGSTGSKASSNAQIAQLIALAPLSSSCPPDAVKASGTTCTDDGNVCTADVCNGTVGAPACTHPAGNAGTVCRASAGVCDPAETCTGASPACPADAKSPAGTVCRASAGVCDIAETCDGTSNACPADAFQPSSTVCRAAAGDCDAAETCTGSGATCPADAV